MNQTRQTPHLLEIYIGQHCWNCTEALAIAEQARQIQGIMVQVIDLDQPGSIPPAHIFAVPTYVLNGKVIALGNPERQKFLASLQAQAERTP